MLHADAFNGAGGCHYVARGEQPNAITPRCPIDNGEWTVMRFPGLSKKPAVYVVTGKAADEERLARQHEEGDFVVVEEIAPSFRLRLGDDAIDIVNQAYDPAGHPGGAGTVAPSVSRDLINAAK
jgi:type IV secretion system protein VirB9